MTGCGWNMEWFLLHVLSNIEGHARSIAKTLRLRSATGTTRHKKARRIGYWISLGKSVENRTFSPQPYRDVFTGVFSQRYPTANAAHNVGRPFQGAHIVTLLLLLVTTTAYSRSTDDCTSWPLWQQFKSLYVSNDGRVIDASTPARITTSEGQSYALLFALAANDRAAFDVLLHWTENNLAAGDLATTLPAWQWGRSNDNQWRVLDSNPASDADVWMAYALSEAGRLWREPRYTQLGFALSEHILRDEVMAIPRLGLTLLPGPRGFVEGDAWRLNASYMPLHVLRYLGVTHNKLWNEVATSSLQVILASAPHGFAADWIEYRTDTGFMTDRSTRGVGSYNAIRVYLWAGMLHANDPAYPQLTQQLAPALKQFAGQARPAEQIDVNTLEAIGTGSPGFAAALVPLLLRAKHNEVAALRADIQQHALHNNQAYFSDALTLFGLGASDGWLRFDSHGQLLPNWRTSCAAH